MIRSKNIPDKATRWYVYLYNRIMAFLPDKGFFILLSVITLIAFMACYDFSPTVYFVQAGEIAQSDITADRPLLIEDHEATLKKKDEVRQNQPLVCDLVLEPVEKLRKEMQELFIAVNRAESPEDMDRVREALADLSGVSISEEDLTVFSNLEVQEAIIQDILPSIQKQFAQGVISEMRVLLPYRTGIIVRDLVTGDETLRSDIQSIPDMKSIEAMLSQKLNSFPGNKNSKRVVTSLLTTLFQPTLIPNYSTTADRTESVVAAVAPVVHNLARGEIIVRQGERVSKDQEVKIQSLWREKASRFDTTGFIGIIVIGGLLSTGLLFSPSGKPASPLHRRDYVFISFVLGLFALIAKGLYLIGIQISHSSIAFSPDWMAYAVPVVGAASLAAMVFSTRRYLVTGLLLAFFCTLMVKGGLDIFIFYFMSAMWGTWLTSRTKSRQDVVWSILPMLFGLLAMWFGSTFLYGGDMQNILPEGIAVVCGVLLSAILTIAIAPVAEMVFGYTTRFRLMELLNLDQPLLRDLMLNAPGTYHHSLIVSNMVEAGANDVGAYALLCKVAALYHDIGKVSKANYFIENQNIENPHDKLTPSMSALVLTSHVKQGVELAEEHNLGREVVDIIQQHHGTGVIKFFYHKAKNLADGIAPNIEDFSYIGPKPQTKEAAIVMLADVVEASSRTLADPSPTKLRQHIEMIIKSFYSDGQLDESELTFKDLDKLTDSFQRILRGIFHQRIVYPDKKVSGEIIDIEKEDKQGPEESTFIAESPSSLTQ